MTPSYSSALLTDAYQLSMIQTYVENQMLDLAVFELYVRNLPRDRNFLIAAGINPALDFLETLQFTPDELQWLKETHRYSTSFLHYLKNFRFTGQVDGVLEGSIVFQNEPLLRVIAPLPEAQFVESRLINLIQFQTMIASKAIRTHLAAQGRQIIDFGFRRSHGAEAGIMAARASYMVGFHGTSTVESARLYGIPFFGTMAHSFIQAHPSEELAFTNYALSQKSPVIFLIDTYNIKQAALTVSRITPQLRAQGAQIQGVRIDSGNLIHESQEVREIFNQHQLEDLKIFVSGNLDERAIENVLQSQAPIDGFGVGTKLNTSADAPYLECVYKLQEYAGELKQKYSQGKSSLPGRKQIYRVITQEGELTYDLLALQDETPPLLPSGASATPLLSTLMEHGKRKAAPETLEIIQKRVLSQVSQLPKTLRALNQSPAPYPVKLSASLQHYAQRNPLTRSP